MIELFVEKKDCCGCTACAQVCPCGAIAIRPDEEGFLYPVIDAQRCTGCGLCLRACAWNNNPAYPERFAEPLVYAVRHRSGEARMKSSSGGAFTAFSDIVLEQGGTVYGAAFDERMDVMHTRAETPSQRDALRGSKYVQSNPDGMFSQVRADLLAGRRVLFSGTPCQTAGLRSFLGDAAADRLVLCDLVCHGVPSPLMWREHLSRLEKALGSPVAAYDFRDKSLGWHRHIEKAVGQNGRADSASLLSQEHKELFYAHTALRPSCHDCRYASFGRPSDITLADFRGIGKTMPDFDDDRGVSLVLVSTEKGRALFDAARDRLECRPGDTRSCLQPNLLKPTGPSPRRAAFWALYRRRGYAAAVRRYAGLGLRPCLKKTVKRTLLNIGLMKK